MLPRDFYGLSSGIYAGHGKPGPCEFLRQKPAAATNIQERRLLMLSRVPPSLAEYPQEIGATHWVYKESECAEDRDIVVPPFLSSLTVYLVFHRLFIHNYILS